MSATASGQQTAQALFRFSEQPVFYAAVIFADGIVFDKFAWRPPSWWLLAALVSLSAAAFFGRKRVAVAIVLAVSSLFPLGALDSQMDLASAPPLPDLTRFEDGEVIVTGHVIRNGLIHDAGRKESQTLDLETEEILAETDLEKVSFGIRVNVYALEPGEEGTSAEENPEHVFYRYGDRIQFPAKLRAPRNYGNPGAMDYRGYLLSNGIIALASVKESKVIQLDGTTGTQFGFLRSRMRQSLVNHMLGLASGNREHTALFAMNKEDVGLLAAMIIGEQSLLQRNVKTDFQRTGAFHILVVSGMNVGILAFVIFWLSRAFHAGEYTATLITIVLSLFYAYVTDLGPPIVRAAIMLSLYLAARLIYRERFSLNSIGISALLVLVAVPQSVFDPSFQLTFLSVIALSAIAQPLIERTTHPYAQALTGLEFTSYDATIPPRAAQFRLDLRLLCGRIANLLSFNWLKSYLPEAWNIWLSYKVVTLSLRLFFAILNLILITGLMQLALALPMVFYFHRLALLGLPANMVVIPLTEILMPMGIAATLLSYVSKAIAAIPTAVTAVTLHGISFTIAKLGGIRFADWRTATPQLSLSIACAAALTFAIFSMKKHRLIAAMSIAGLLAGAGLLLIPPKPRLRAGAAEITAIDVGQGDSIFVASPDGHMLLIDGGGPAGFLHSNSFDVGEDVVSPYLWSRGITRVDAIALTHAHSDHMAGLHSALANFRPRELWVGVDSLAPDYLKLLEEARAQGVAIVHRRLGDEFEYGGMEIRVLSPTESDLAPGEKRNNESIVMRIDFKQSSALLMGDAEKQSEFAIAQNTTRVDLLKVAHHGSATSTTQELLTATQPKFAVISVGYHNFYGHPKAEVLDRLFGAHVRTFRTDHNGVATFYLDGKQVTPEVGLPGMH